MLPVPEDELFWKNQRKITMILLRLQGGRYYFPTVYKQLFVL